MNEYCQRVMMLNFAQDTDIDSAEVIWKVLADLGLPAHEILAQAISDENKLKLRRQTETAKALGIFGAPMFFVGKEMFWGNDRLDEALEYCVNSID
ncbi:MAG: hypothetical protein CFE44_25810 [Burkholderiales bacterium PBB4]|nr:MAG: hypothetical protein CFE44_25810 [Burkholderiales bacterium PBB4]